MTPGDGEFAASLMRHGWRGSQRLSCEGGCGWQGAGQRAGGAASLFTPVLAFVQS